MLAVRDTSIVGQVKETIASYEANGQALKYIELTYEEMKEFYESLYVTTMVGAQFGAEEVPLVVNITGVKKDGDVPKSLWYSGVRIIRE